MFVNFFVSEIVCLIFKLFLSACILNPTCSVVGLYQLKDINIDKYYLSSTKLKTKRAKSDDSQDMRPEFWFNIMFDDNIYHAVIKKRNSDVIIPNKSSLTIYLDSNISYTEKINMAELYEGYIMEKPKNSSLDGYVSDGSFCGHVLIDSDFYYIDGVRDVMNYATIDSVDDLNKAFGDRNNFRYDQFYDSGRSSIGLDIKKAFAKWKQNGCGKRSMRTTGRKYVISTGVMLCSLVVIIDNSFLTVLHGGNRAAAIYQCLLSLEEANAIFRTTDFDDDDQPDNVGFYVKNLVVIETENAPYFLVNYRTDPRSINNVFFRLTTYRELPKYCLGIHFTAQSFKSKVLGASYMPDPYPGGVCAKPLKDKMFNILVVTTMTREHRVPQAILDTTVAHEIGHSFGSYHDTTADCFGHLMSPETFNDFKSRKHITFSSCSKKQILPILVRRGGCFEPVTSPFCGNGILEEGEECDCGITLDCLQKDACCNPRRSRGSPCKVNKRQGYQCHPSQGRCCNKKCTYARDIPHVDCMNFTNKCPCPEDQSHCKCGINGRCIKNQCHSMECTRLDLTECRCQVDKLNSSCQICCLLNSDCLPSVQASRQLLTDSSSKSTFQRLITKPDDRGAERGKRETFCQKDEKSCVNLYFFQGKAGGYCLRYGKLGRCNQRLDCDIFPNQQSFPLIGSASMSVVPNGFIPILLDVIVLFCRSKYIFT